MGISILQAPHSEVAPHEPLREPPTFEYYPAPGDFDSNKSTPTCKLTIVARNHLKYEADSDKIIYGTLEVTGQTNSDGVGFTFKFENVKFEDEALNIVWSIRASAYVAGHLVRSGAMDLPGILVTLTPVAPLKPVANDPPKPVVDKFATF